LHEGAVRAIQEIDAETQNQVSYGKEHQEHRVIGHSYPKESFTAEEPQAERGHRVPEQHKQCQVQHDSRPHFSPSHEQHHGAKNQTGPYASNIDANGVESGVHVSLLQAG
jgi:hypothetical protein